MGDDSQIRLQQEFQQALSKGEEAAEVIRWPLPWDAGAPSPHVVASEHKTILIYMVAEHYPNSDGKDVRIVDPSSGAAERLAIVTFRRCYSHKFGGPNDEVLKGHPLYGRGLTWYGAHLIHNSMWLMQEEATNSVHDRFDASNWRKRRHYLLCFHDTIFECLAEGYEAEELATTFREALAEATRRLLA